MLSGNFEFEGLTGVGRVCFNLVPDRRVYTFIGANGVGKTKALESLFQVMFLSNQIPCASQANGWMSLNFSAFISDSVTLKNVERDKDGDTPIRKLETFFIPLRHTLPVIFLGAQSRGALSHDNNNFQKVMGNFEQRKQSYFESIIKKVKNDFGSLNMDSTIEEWFITLARSSNPYQRKEDNRDVEIKTVIKLLNAIDSRIDAEFLEISGDNRVSLKIEGQKRELSQLSSGFTSILKLIQAIVSGYGYFTNETHLQRVKGIVLIDEIESHLHLTWQANIIPLLKTLFPHTTFYITTHSSVVLSQLQEGEAYKLERDSSGIVRTQMIEAPNKAALIDIMNDVFHVDLNQMKLDNSSADDQREAKASLLQLLKQQGSKE